MKAKTKTTIFTAALVACLFGICIASPVRSMIGADGTEKSDEWNPTAADYIQDGLVAMWDGIENAGYGIHDDNATTWKDLVSTNDLRLQSTAIADKRFTWLEDGLRHEGANDGFRGTRRLWQFTGENNAFTISYLVNFERIIPSLPRYMPCGDEGGGTGFYWRGENFFSYMPWAEYGITVPISSLVGHDMSVSYGADTSSHFVSYNGIRYGERQSGDYSALLTKSVSFFSNYGYNPSGENSWICTAKRILIYNRKLTAEEDAHNYIVDRLRFNLP